MYLYGPANIACCCCIGKTLCRLVHVCLLCGGSVAKRLERWTCNMKVLFLESSSNFSGPESCFVFEVFVFKSKVLIILRIIR